MRQNLRTNETIMQGGDCNEDDITELLSKMGWKWAVMASTVNKIYKSGNSVSGDLISKIRTSKTVVESGCYSVCDVNSELIEIEKELFSYLVNTDHQQTTQFQDLVAKAMSGTIKEGEIDLTGTNVLLSDCLSLPCVCT
ncbi:MAG: hypothetical protein ACW99A_17560 [Candidatus Kariarchaeaceae archaeon]